MIVDRALRLRRIFVLLWTAAWLTPTALAGNEAIETRMRKDITFLASDECEGRGPATKGINLAADYIAHEFQKAGLKPSGAGGSYFQPFSISTGARLASPNTVVLHGPQGQAIELRQGVHFQVAGLSGSGKLRAPLAFAGFAATAKGPSYDDFHGIDAAGKLLIVLRRTPRSGNTQLPFDGKQNNQHAALVTKIKNAEEHGAAGVIFVNDAGTAGSDDRLMDFGYTGFDRMSNSKLVAVQIRRTLVDTMFVSGMGKRLSEIEADIDMEVKPHSAVLDGWTASLEVHVDRTRTPVKNIVGVLEGSGPLANETIVIGAHYDHLGYGGFGSLARDLAGKAIHHGADDNGSGTTMLIELARRFGHTPNRDGRRLVFIAFSGEERGLLGSGHYCRNPVFPIKDTVAMINMDMVGRLRPDKDSGKDKLIVYGTGTATTFDKLIDSINAKYDFKLQKIKTGMGPSDQQSFYEQKVPVFFFFTGDHPDYHRPGDTADKINFSGMSRIANMVEELVAHLDTDTARPQYVLVPGGSTYAGMQGGPTLGIRPAYDDEREGLLLNGVSPGGPAAKAGLQQGDRIMEMAGKQVRDIGAYMTILAGQKKGNTIEIVIMRDGKRLTLKAIL